jgi:hypothetical protein
MFLENSTTLNNRTPNLLQLTSGFREVFATAKIWENSAGIFL